MTSLAGAGRLEGKVALITGAARGQGRSHAVRMAEEGADIIAVDICRQIETAKYQMPGPEELEETARLVGDTGRRIVTAEADVRSQAELDSAVAAGVEKLGRLDIAVANAGISSIGKGHELTEAQWNDMIDINLSGVWRTTKAAIPVMIECGNGGTVGITSSYAGFTGFPNSAHYVGAKHALVGLMKSIAAEAAPYGIRVNSVHPTNVNTKMIMYQDFYDFFAPDKEPATKEDFAEVCASMQLLPDLPWIEPVDISNALIWLATDEARYMTGVALPIDGGAAAK